MRLMSICALSAGLVLLEGAGLGAQDLYVYPTKNQSDEQTGRDKEECHDWAVKQTGVDPVAVAAQPPASSRPGGSGAVGGAAVGAARGAMSGDAGAGAVHGFGIGRLVHAVR